MRRFPNLNEFFVHHEDVRRANGRGPRTNSPAMDAALWRNVSRATSTGLGGRNLEMRDRGLAIDEVLVILGVEHGGLDVGSREPDDGSP